MSWLNTCRFPAVATMAMHKVDVILQADQAVADLIPKLLWSPVKPVSALGMFHLQRIQNRGSSSKGL